ncbi:MAG: helix-turn-helix domain-containing protein, partial [Meiothermus silvanus]|nr:helix-turn-helix domain-containing protein [Allomeiothermus silvanus]
MELYYTVEELARTLKVSEEAIRKRLRGGEIRGVRLGRTWRV